MMLEVENLSVVFRDRRPPLTAVDGVSFQMGEGELLGLAGESGSGKSRTAHAILGLLPAAAEVSGGVRFQGRDLLTMSSVERRQVQGKDISIVFQEPMTSLNPTMRVGRQVEDALRVHTKMAAPERKTRALEAMELAGLPDPERVYRAWPHELSGGMRQRAMIASALVLRPRLLIADEPTTALDVTVQAKILDTLREINRKEGTAILLISHDLLVIRNLCTRVAVMKDGRIVESGPVDQVFQSPREDYTKLLIASRPTRKKLQGGGSHG